MATHTSEASGKTWTFVVRPGYVECQYADDLPELNLGGETMIRRASHVNPILPPGWWEYLLACLWPLLFRQLRLRKKYHGHFCIQWQGKVKKVMGSPVFCDGRGMPFYTKRQAEDYEVYLLRVHYFKVVAA